jgi:hypothetical protein
MGLFDMFKDKAAELIQTAKDQVSDLAGVDLPAAGETVTEQVQQATDQVSDIPGTDVQADTLIDTVAGSVTEAGHNAAEAAHHPLNDAVNSATDKLTGA